MQPSVVRQLIAALKAQRHPKCCAPLKSGVTTSLNTRSLAHDRDQTYRAESAVGADFSRLKCRQSFANAAVDLKHGIHRYLLGKLDLEQIAATEGLSVPRFISTLHSEVLQVWGEVANFTSHLRCICLVAVEEGRVRRGPNEARAA